MRLPFVLVLLFLHFSNDQFFLFLKLSLSGKGTMKNDLYNSLWWMDGWMDLKNRDEMPVALKDTCRAFTIYWKNRNETYKYSVVKYSHPLHFIYFPLPSIPLPCDLFILKQHWIIAKQNDQNDHPLNYLGLVILTVTHIATGSIVPFYIAINWGIHPP